MLFIVGIHLDLIIAREPIYKGHAFKTACFVDHDINDGKREPVLRAGFIEAAKSMQIWIFPFF